MPETESLGYLADVGRYEWALSVAAHAPDVPPIDLGALIRIEPASHDRVRFAAHPSVTLLHLESPADVIADAVLSGDERMMASINVRGGPIWLAVNRGPGGIEAERLDMVTYGFLSRLCAGDALGALLDNAVPDAANILARQFTGWRLAGFSTASTPAHEETSR